MHHKESYVPMGGNRIGRYRCCRCCQDEITYAAWSRHMKKSELHLRKREEWRLQFDSDGGISDEGEGSVATEEKQGTEDDREGLG
jgi:hypothetical protein